MLEVKRLLGSKYPLSNDQSDMKTKNSTRERGKLPIVRGTLLREMKQLTGEGDFGLGFAARRYDEC